MATCLLFSLIAWSRSAETREQASRWNSECSTPKESSLTPQRSPWHRENITTFITRGVIRMRNRWYQMCDYMWQSALFCGWSSCKLNGIKFVTTCEIVSCERESCKRAYHVTVSCERGVTESLPCDYHVWEIYHVTGCVMFVIINMGLHVIVLMTGCPKA
jgi:hypothetical protein